MRIIWLLFIFCLLFVSCTKDLYYAERTSVIELFDTHGVTCKQLDDTTIKIHTFKQSEVADADYRITEEGYYKFPYAAKTTEILFWFPLSVAFYPLLFVVPIAPDRVNSASIPFLLLNPVESVAYSSQLVSTGERIQKQWINFREKSSVYPSPQTTIFINTPSQRYRMATNLKGNLTLDIREVLNAKELEKSNFVIGHTEFRHTVAVENGKIKHISAYQRLSQKSKISQQRNIENGNVELTLDKDYFVYGDHPQLGVFTSNLEGKPTQCSIKYKISFVMMRDEDKAIFFPPQFVHTLGQEQFSRSPFSYELEMDSGLISTNVDGKAQFSFSARYKILHKALQIKSLSVAQQYNFTVSEKKYAHIKIDFTITDQNKQNHECTFLFPIHFPSLSINVTPSREVFKMGKDNHLDILVTDLDAQAVQAKLVVAMNDHIMHLTTSKNGNIRIAIPQPQLSFSRVPGVYTKKFLEKEDTKSFPVTIWAVGKNGLRGKKKLSFSYNYHDLIGEMKSSD